MAPKKKTITEQDVIHSGLQAASTLGINNVTMADIAEKLDMEEKALYPFIQKPSDVFNLITRQANTALASDYICDGNTPKRDQYFDLIMERLDLLQPYKTDIAQFIKNAPKSPLMLATFFPDFDRGIVLMMRLAGETSLNHTRRLGLTWAYLSTMRVWIKDDSEDGAKTMAHLDKALGRLENLSDKFPFKRQAA